jgi:phosphate starvation-inducible protein PhoH
MESIVVYPQDDEQLEMVKGVLKALKVQFEPQQVDLPAHIKKSIEKSLKQFEGGQSISFQDFKKKHFIHK